MNRARILVVEDDPVIGHDLRSRLEAMGHTVAAVAGSGDEALRRAGEDRPDLVLLDIALSGTPDGPETAERIETTLGIPVVFMAGQADQERLDRVRPTMPFARLLEPFTDHELEMAVDMARYVSWIDAERRRTEQERDRILEMSRDLICVAGADGYFKYVNPAWQDVLGYTPEELLSRPILDFIHPDDHAKNDAEVERLTAGRPTADYENRYVHRDGSVRTISWTAAPDPAGDRFYCVGREVTDRRRAEEALHRSEERYRTLVETAAEGIGVAQGDRLVFVNDMAEPISGWTKEALLGRPFLEFVHPEDRDGVARRHVARLEGETLPQRNRYRLLRPDGSITWVEANSVPIDWAGRPATLNLFTDVTERETSEKTRRESEGRYRQLFENMSSGVAVYEVQDDGQRFVIKDMNRAGERMTKVSKAEVVGRNVRDAFPGVEALGLLDVFRRVWRTGAPQEHASSRYVDDRLDFRVENYVYKLPSGELVAVYDDVTERVRAEKALRDSRREWEQIFEAIGHPTLILDPEHGLVNANRAALETVGRPREEVLGRKCYEIFHGTEAPPSGCPLEDLLTAGASDTVEMEMEALDRVFLVRCTPMHDEDGRVVRIIHIATDITERKQAEEALRDSEELYRNLIETSPDAIIVADLYGRLTSFNQQTLSLYDFSNPEEAWSSVTNILERVVPADRERFVVQIRETFQTGGIRTGEFMLLKKDGATFPAEVRVAVLKNKYGQPTGTISSIRDITERRRLEEQFLKSQKMEAIGQLTAGIAHEFNNLMTVVINYSDLAAAGLPPGDPVNDDLRQIKIAGERAAELTKQILTFGRRQIIAPRVLDLNQLVTERERMLRRAVGESVELVMRLDPALGGVKADLGQLEQVLINLALNARDAMPQGGRLVVSTSNVHLDEGVIDRDLDSELPPGRYVRLSVADTGPGIDREILPKIFDPFFTTKDRAVHNGLGLSMVYGMVTQAGGGLEVETEPGRGAAFHIYLPPSDEPAERPRDGRPPGEPAPPRETILVVEDDALVRRMICRLLETKGYRVLAAADGQEALAAAERHGGVIDLLLTDVVMPGESGPRVAARLKEGHPGLEVIYLSGYPEDIVVKHGVVLDEVHLISKPFAPEDLVREIRRILDGTS